MSAVTLSCSIMLNIIFASLQYSWTSLLVRISQGLKKINKITRSPPLLTHTSPRHVTLCAHHMTRKCEKKCFLWSFAKFLQSKPFDFQIAWNTTSHERKIIYIFSKLAPLFAISRLLELHRLCFCSLLVQLVFRFFFCYGPTCKHTDALPHLLCTIPAPSPRVWCRPLKGLLLTLGYV